MRSACECDAVTAACACGAMGRILPPDFGYQDDACVPLVEWHGGNIGDGRVAVEPLPASRSVCPGCHRRADVYFVSIPRGLHRGTMIAPADHRARPNESREEGGAPARR